MDKGLTILVALQNVYSFALTFQSFGRYAQAIPRFFLCIVCTAICAFRICSQPR